MAHKNAHLARRKAAYKDSDRAPRLGLADQLRDYMFIHSTPRAKADPDRVPFNYMKCSLAVQALTVPGRLSKFVTYREFRTLVKNTWVRDEVWYLACANQ